MHGPVNGEVFNLKRLDFRSWIIQKETENAQKYGVNSTPTTFVNNQKMLGALPYEQFKSVIDGILAKK